MIVHLKNLIVHNEYPYKKRYIIRLLINLICFVNFQNFENIGSSYSIGKNEFNTIIFSKNSIKNHRFLKHLSLEERWSYCWLGRVIFVEIFWMVSPSKIISIRVCVSSLVVNIVNNVLDSSFCQDHLEFNTNMVNDSINLIDQEQEELQYSHSFYQTFQIIH